MDTTDTLLAVLDADKAVSRIYDEAAERRDALADTIERRKKELDAKYEQESRRSADEQSRSALAAADFSRSILDSPRLRAPMAARDRAARPGAGASPDALRRPPSPSPRASQGYCVMVHTAHHTSRYRVADSTAM